ncbi:peptide ABC transporter substrate-binding protein [Aerophototrophica crusticola]|uniref:Peptide ABC transporter substrate-binding protein n=1 Tax=Aerophototrophica crusticola TaxID=1709002 RepID=A0A858R3S9_9PROT|nr:peptide ABC transporter substrate-binding protein [Rhodospirillaceae bacterium B3]
MRIALAALVALSLALPAGAEVVFRRGIGPSPDTLDPTKGELQPSARMTYDLFEGLFSLDGQGQRRNAMAESHEVSPDGLTYTFKLREAKWSDGTPVTADDFVFGWRRLADPKHASPYGYYMWPVLNGQAIGEGKKKPEELGVQAVDARTLKVTLAEPTGYFLATLQHPSTFPVNRASVEKHGEAFVQPGKLVSNGPYMLVESVPQSHLKAVKNPHYYDAANVQVDTVMSYPIDNNDTEFKRFRAGELDATETLPVTQNDFAKQNLPDAFTSGSTYSTYYLSFNMTNPFWRDNPKLRAALYLAIDRDVIATKVMNGSGQPAWTFTPPGKVGGYEPPLPAAAKQTQAERDKLAKQLLAEAGFGPGGKPLPPVDLLYSTSENNRRVLVAVAAMWKQKLGVETQLNNQEFRVVASIGNEKAYKDIIFYAWIGDYPDPYTFLQLLRGDVGQQNFPGYKSAEYDRLTTEANRLTDPEKRLSLLAQAEAVALADYPVAPVFHNVRRRLVSPAVKGWTPNPPDFNLPRFLTVGK